MAYPTIRRGSRGEAVKTLQSKLGITVDGIFGTQTEEAVKQFQRNKGLKVDGIVGSQTWGALMGGSTSPVTRTTPEGTRTTMPVTTVNGSGEVTLGSFFNTIVGGVILYGLFQVLRKIF